MAPSRKKSKRKMADSPFFGLQADLPKDAKSVQEYMRDMRTPSPLKPKISGLIIGSLDTADKALRKHLILEHFGKVKVDDLSWTLRERERRRL